jgi:hypothetical protein
MWTTKALVAGLLACGAFSIAPPARAEEKDTRPAAGVQDNSFLIEEAYNQEAGVVQHINGLRRLNKSWFYTFTQEWPVGSQLHQVSYTVPYTWLRTDAGREQGFGDVQLNYRYQLSMETATRPAIAPRASLITPSGNDDKGLGAGSYGAQFAIPVSKIVTDRITLHANAGLTHYFDVHGQAPTSYYLGASAIYAVDRNLNLMLETLQEWNESVNDQAAIERTRAFTLSPGARYALNFDGGTQVVVGAAVPIQFAQDGKRDYGAFVYLSIEHNLFAATK